LIAVDPSPFWYRFEMAVQSDVDARTGVTRISTKSNRENIEQPENRNNRNDNQEFHGSMSPR